MSARRKLERSYRATLKKACAGRRILCSKWTWWELGRIMPEEVQIPISWDKDDGLGRLFDSVVLERPVQDGVLDLSRGDVVTHHFVLRGRGRLHEGPFGTCESAPCPVSHVMSD